MANFTRKNTKNYVYFEALGGADAGRTALQCYYASVG